MEEVSAFKDSPRLTQSSSFFSVLVEETTAASTTGSAYKAYGIADGGAIIVARPDGYVGTVVRPSEIHKLSGYFSKFLL